MRIYKSLPLHSNEAQWQ